MTRKYILTIIFIVSALIYILSQPSLAVEIEKCKDCHGTVKPIQTITKSCSLCHGTHSSSPEPRTRDPIDVHIIHSTAGKSARQSSCLGCHQSPIECTKCHNSHDLESIKRSIAPKVMKNVIRNDTNMTGNDTNISSIDRRSIKNESKQNISVKIPSCVDCHGQLPYTGGHVEFRKELSMFKHGWMRCGSCHLNPYAVGGDYKFELRFKNIFTVPIDDSIKICKICHSLQYDKMIEGNHGTINKTCVNCHNPHTTQSTGSKFGVTPIPKATPINVSTNIEIGKKWLFEKVPILNNPVLLIIMFILTLVFVSEYALSRHEEGEKVAYSMVKFQSGEETLKTLEIKSKIQDISSVNDLLGKYGNILGMTMVKEEDKEDHSLVIYKFVIFIDMKSSIDEAGESELVDKILSLDDIKNDIKSVQLTDKYEL